IDGRRIVKSLLKTTIASISMALPGWFIIRSDIWKVSGMAAVKSLYLGGTITLCLIIYIMVCLVLKSDEIRYVYNMIRKRGIDKPA
ncbi:MAG: hypothetical protein ACK415_09490, partial [Thermodesulfovibrionales bacterium]